MNHNLYRKAALERMASPEKLDILLTITRPRHWLALIAIVMLIVAFFIWAVCSTIPVQTKGSGVFVLQGGMTRIVSTVEGQLTDSSVQVGDPISRGDVVARLFNPAWVAPASGTAPNVSQQLLLKSRIVSLESGTVTELHARPGQWLKAGEPLFTLDLASEDKKAETVVYVSPEVSKQIQPGMQARIWPNQDRNSENGAIIGHVLSVSGVPASLASIERSVGNREVAQQFLQTGSVMEIRVALETDARHSTGFHWTAPRAHSNFRAQTGMLCSVDFIVGSVRPINWIF